MVDIRVDMRDANCPVGSMRVDCRGQTCPIPLVEVRKALKRAKPGEVIEVLGTHPASKKEIPMAAQALKVELLSVEGTDTNWRILLRR
jgi:tRNA 2-thiouridine synthesizing protein A